METLVLHLQNLKDAIPVNCTLFNLQRLKIHFLEFKKLLLSLPDQLIDLKNQAVSKLEWLQLKIDALGEIIRPRQKVTYAFQEATSCLKAEIDAVVARIQAL